MKASQFNVSNSQQEQIEIPLFFLAMTGDSGETRTSDLVEEIRKKHFKILVVDDEDAFRRSFCFKLRRKYSAEVEDVNSGSLAIAAVLRGETYDLIFTDIMMPGMKGTETFEQLQRIDPNLKVVIMSAFSDSDEWKKAQDMGAVLIHKPIDDDLLIKILIQNH